MLVHNAWLADYTNVFAILDSHEEADQYLRQSVLSERSSTFSVLKLLGKRFVMQRTHDVNLAVSNLQHFQVGVAHACVR